MIKKIMTKNIVFRWLITDIIIILFCIINDNYIWLINTQVAFISSLLISIATFFSYKNNVIKQVNSEYKKQFDDLDMIDKIDDPYDLYSSDINEEIIINPTKEQILEANKPIKQNYFKNFKKTFLSYASFYRLSAYIVLIVNFFYLNNNGLLSVYPYLLGFLIVPISSLSSQYK